MKIELIFFSTKFVELILKNLLKIYSLHFLISFGNEYNKI